MTEQDPAGNVVRVRQFGKRLEPKAAGLIEDIQGPVVSGLMSLLGGMLDKADDALFDLANKAGSDKTQQLYFDAMREIRRRRAGMETGFESTLRSTFADFIEGRPVGIERQRQDGGDDSEFALVDDEEVEESIAVKNMAAKVRRAYFEDLFELTERFRAIARNPDLDESGHPLSPGAVALAFRGAVSPLDVEIQIKLVIYKLFDKYVMSGLGGVYREINQKLIRKGIVPKIRRTVRKSTTVDAPRQGGAGAPGGGLPASGSGPQGATGSAGGGAGDSMSRPGNVAGYIGPNTTLVGALSNMQSELVEQGNLDEWSPNQLAVRVLDLSRQVGGARGEDQRRADEKTINMVSMIFDFILDDANVPDPVKALIARLQIPVLKVALIDETFFSSRNHPARQLLNEMAEASIGWAGETEADHEPLLNMIDYVVDRVLAEFEDDPNVFQSLLDEFREYVASERERAEVFEERIQKTVEGKERVELARRRIDAWIDMWVSQQNVPKFVRRFLRDTWKDTLLITMHRHGEDSLEWTRCIKTVNNLLWSLTPNKSAKGGRFLVDLLPELLRELREGMELASAHPDTIEAFFDELAKCHARSVNGGLDRDVFQRALQQSESLPERAEVDGAEETEAGSGEVDFGDLEVDGTKFDVSEHEGTVPLLSASIEDDFEIDDELLNIVPELGDDVFEVRGSEDSAAMDGSVPVLDNVIEEIVLSEPDSTQYSESERDAGRDEHMELAEGLEIGTWVEFRTDGEITRAKLSWKSPLTQCYLFVNRKGVKVAEKTAPGLASDLRSGRAVVLEEVPLLDRALSAVRSRDKSAASE